MLQIIKGLLTVVSLLMKWADEQQLKQLGADLNVKKQLAEMAVRTGMAKRIDLGSEHYSPDDIERILHKHFRD